MVALVSLDRVKQALRIDADDQDALLEFYIVSASRAVVRHLKKQAQVVLGLDDDGELPSGAEVPEDVEMAVIYLVGHFLREPDGDVERAFEDGTKLPRPVTAMLYDLRDPTLA